MVAYEDLFEVIDRDADGKKFDKVSRFKCRSQFEAELQIDINVDIYKLEVGAAHPSLLFPPSRPGLAPCACAPLAAPRELDKPDNCFSARVAKHSCHSGARG